MRGKTTFVLRKNRFGKMFWFSTVSRKSVKPQGNNQQDVWGNLRDGAEAH